MNSLTRRNLSAQIWPVLVLILIFLYNAFVNPAFFNFMVNDGRIFGSIVDVALRASPLILVALGMTLVIATGGIDLSVGTVAALAASVAAFCFAKGFDFYIVLICALASGVAVGLFNSLLIVGMGTQPIVASLVAMVAGRGVAQLLIDGQIIPLKDPSYLFVGTGYLFGTPFVIGLVVVIAVALQTFLKKTSTSMFIEALGSNPEASKFIGLDTRVILTFVYISSGLLAAMAGIALSANIRAVDVNNLGTFLELDAILAVVIGGTRLTGGKFSLFGSIVGALIIQTVTTTINTQGIAIEAMLMVKALVVIIICLLQSETTQRLWMRRKARS